MKAAKVIHGVSTWRIAQKLKNHTRFKVKQYKVRPAKWMVIDGHEGQTRRSLEKRVAAFPRHIEASFKEGFGAK